MAMPVAARETSIMVAGAMVAVTGPVVILTGWGVPTQRKDCSAIVAMMISPGGNAIGEVATDQPDRDDDREKEHQNQTWIFHGFGR
jgi:hypothetical protein